MAEVQLPSGRNGIIINELYCPSRGNIVAIGSTIDLLKPEGITLYSEDRGATWEVATLQPPATDVTLSLVQLPSPEHHPALYASGYRRVHPFLDESGPWWISEDDGRTWSATTVRLPLGRPKGFLPSFPKIVKADQAGTLVTAVAESTGPLSHGVFLLRSTDSGEHWDKRLLQAPTDYASPIVSDGNGNLAFWGISLPRHPFALSSYESMVYWSSDAGGTWQEGKPNNVFPSAMRLYRSLSGAMVLFNAEQRKFGFTVIYYSTDNGQTWKAPREILVSKF